ncbi:MAG: hypothetical protein K2X11_00735 [Acetobacteraceae bacterium]|nr:hypothetical protein [Acetobacteraceae bacterium]
MRAFSFDLAPVVPLWLIAALALLSLIVLVPAALRGARGTAWRALAFALVLGALANPRLVEETRETRPDIALLVVDRSDSTRFAQGHAAAIEAARRQVEQRGQRLRDVEWRVAEVEEGGNTGTRAFAAIERALADIPAQRLAAVILLSDGQVHDAPEALPFDAPFHLLLPGRPGEVDRRIRIIEAPGFGIVGREVELRVIVEDLGAPRGGEAAARLTLRRDGGAPRTEMVPVGREHRIAVPIERGGPTVLDILAETRPGEVAEVNNRAVVTINGVRDRLRVLLVSGEPHAGERTWRRLLKSDPGVDLVHFTILRPPEKDDLTPLNELALIAFPVRELFQVKLRDFDLIVFDRFANRGILPPSYLRNIADYVRQGGALLLSVGPEYVGAVSLANTPLGQVLPARPLPPQQAILEQAFRPRVTLPGQRHPVTEGLPGANVESREASWGRWYRTIRTESRAGATLMEGANDAPLLVLDRVGQGRVALMLSDHIWLWSRGHDGGGPQQELLRRTAHWLMREPELEEEDLTARVEAGRLHVTRRSLDAGPPPEAVVTAPDGTVTRHPLTAGTGGRATLDIPAETSGLWQVGDGRRLAFAAAMPPNPPEVADLRSDPTPLASLVSGSGGGVRWLGEANALTVPEIRHVAAGRDAAGSGWIGLRKREDHTVTGIAALPLLPGWLALALLLGAVLLAWRRET